MEFGFLVAFWLEPDEHRDQLAVEEHQPAFMVCAAGRDFDTAALFIGMTHEQD